MKKNCYLSEYDFFLNLTGYKKRNFTLNYYQILLIVLLSGLIILTAFNTSSHRLLIKSITELIDSGRYYFQSLFSEEVIPNDGVSFLEFDESIIQSVLPSDIRALGYQFLTTFEIMVNPSYLKDSIIIFGQFLANFANLILILLLPLIIFVVVYYNFVVFKPKEASNATDFSKPLRLYLKFKNICLKPIHKFISKLWMNFTDNKIFRIAFVFVLLYNVNFISFILIFLAWYLYFVFSIDIVSLWYLVCKFLICLSPLLRPFFWPFWIIGIIALDIYFKIKRGYAQLEKMYDKNDEFVDSLGIITGIYGGPGAGKTSLEVAIATQKEVLLRKQARESMMEIRSEFPDFPFREIEKEIEDLSRHRCVVNKIQVEYHFRTKFKDQQKIYGYNLLINKNCHYDQLKVSDIIEELIQYAQLYYIYISSLAASSYSLRYDIGLETGYAYPSLNYHFFTRDFRDDEESRNAKIFDLNLFRLNKQLDNTKYADNIEKNDEKENKITLMDFGVITLSEFGKDRGNRYTNLSRKDREVTPSSDGTGNMFGLIRHLTTVRHKQYGFIVWDEQKLSAFSGSEAAMAETNIFVTRQNDTRLALPLWTFEGTILGWFSEHYNKLYNRYIEIRNDKTLFSYYVFHVSSFFSNLIRNLNNIFGYRRVVLDLSRTNVNGAQVQEGDNAFFMMNKIVYANRYSTDCYKGFFDNLKLQADRGMNQYESFQGSVASIQELVKTNGYFSTELIDSILNYYKKNLDIEKNTNRRTDDVN